MNIRYYIFRDIFWDISSYFAYKSHLWHAQISWILVNTPIFLFVDVFLYTPIFMSGWRLAGATCLSESAFFCYLCSLCFTIFQYLLYLYFIMFYYMVLLLPSSSSSLLPLIIIFRAYSRILRGHVAPASSTTVPVGPAAGFASKKNRRHPISLKQLGFSA